MFSVGLMEELPPVGISSEGAYRWTKQRLAELEGITTNAFWGLSLDTQKDPIVWKKINRLMVRYKTPTEKLFIAKIRRFIRNSPYNQV